MMKFTKTNKTALIAGATGLVGSELVKQLLEDDLYAEVHVLVRRPMEISHPKLKVHQVDFKNLSKHRDVIKGNDLFLCLGTTIKKAGSREEFIRIDYTIPMIIANIAQQHGTQQCILVSSVGAEADSMVFYNKVKGQLENDLKAIDFWAIHIMQPSLLLSMRKEDRFLEGIGQFAAWRINKLAGNMMKSYKAVTAKHVAITMVRRAQHQEEGIYTYPSHIIEKIAKETL